MGGELGVIDPAIGWSMRVAFGGEKQPRDLVAQFHVPVQATPGEINALIDKVARAQDRLIHHYKVAELKDRLKVLLGIIERYERDIIMVTETAQARWERSGRRGEWTPDALSGQEAQAKRSVEDGLRKSRGEAAQLQAEIEELEAANGVGSADVGADRDLGHPAGQDHRHDFPGRANP